MSNVASERATAATWHAVCTLDQIAPWTGVAALIGERQIAIFRIPGANGGDDAVFALGNYDPIGRAFVLSRGIVGSKGEVLKVASPLYKQQFCLRTGRCLDDASVQVPVFATRIDGRRVLVQA